MPGGRKHLKQKDIVDSLQPGQVIVRSLGSRGDNLIEVEFPTGKEDLVLLPARFNKTIWIKKGTFLVVFQDSDQAQSSSRICGTIDAVLDTEDIKELQKHNVWPVEFSAKKEAKADSSLKISTQRQESNDESSASDNDLSPLQPNQNRPVIVYDMQSDSEDEE